jgi:hypothetical protein
MKSIIFDTIIVRLVFKMNQKLHKCLSVANIHSSFEEGYFSFPATKHIQGK